jgi:hypothetical protein
MRFARWVFCVSGAWGVLVVTPLFFLESRLSADYPPAITHPEYYYGFVGVCLAFQVLFLIIGTDPVRLRPAMVAAMLEKLSVVPLVVLAIQGRIDRMYFGFAATDGVMLVLFAIAYVRTGRARSV